MKKCDRVHFERSSFNRKETEETLVQTTPWTFEQFETVCGLR
jgi:hypothetical protein